MTYRKKEVRDFLISILVLGFLFSLPKITAVSLVASFIIVSLTFGLHEIAHRNVARKFGAYSEYKMWPSGLLFALILGIISGGRIIFAAPGAVYISSLKILRWKGEYESIKNEEYGVISIVGPLTNLFLALIFLILNAFYSWWFFSMGASINMIVALFNLLPIPPLDGAKVMAWDRKVWFFVFMASLIGWIGISFI